MDKSDDIVRDVKKKMLDALHAREDLAGRVYGYHVESRTKGLVSTFRKVRHFARQCWRLLVGSPNAFASLWESSSPGGGRVFLFFVLFCGISYRSPGHGGYQQKNRGRTQIRYCT